MNKYEQQVIEWIGDCGSKGIAVLENFISIENGLNNPNKKNSFYIKITQKLQRLLDSTELHKLNRDSTVSKFLDELEWETNNCGKIRKFIKQCIKMIDASIKDHFVEDIQIDSRLNKIENLWDPNSFVPASCLTERLRLTRDEANELHTVIKNFEYQLLDDPQSCAIIKHICATTPIEQLDFSYQTKISYALEEGLSLLQEVLHVIT